MCVKAAVPEGANHATTPDARLLVLCERKQPLANTEQEQGKTRQKASSRVSE